MHATNHKEASDNPVKDRGVPPSGAEFLSARQVQDRYGGRSHMWLRRQMARGLLPAPVYLGTLRFWRLADLIAFENGAPRQWTDAEKARDQRLAEAAA
jgi:hypothetical protein